MRINKYLALSGVGSRRKVEAYVLDGLVKVNGKVITELSFDVNTKKDNVEYILNSNVVKINGNELLESIIINTKGEETELKIDGLFLAIGQIPNNSYIDIIDLDEMGYAIASEDCKTNVDGIYVAGDFRTKKVRQLVTAAADGATAAINAIEYIERCEKDDNNKE
jgi:thioredoxin reductase (NADPH)